MQRLFQNTGPDDEITQQDHKVFGLSKKSPALHPSQASCEQRKKAASEGEACLPYSVHVGTFHAYCINSRFRNPPTFVRKTSESQVCKRGTCGGTLGQASPFAEKVTPMVDRDKWSQYSSIRLEDAGIGRICHDRDHGLTP